MEDAAHSWSLFVYDTRKGLWHREDSTHASEFARVGDELYFLENGTLRTVYGTAGTKRRAGRVDGGDGDHDVWPCRKEIRLAHQSADAAAEGVERRFLGSV